jgi:hypothetical protein
MNQVVEHVTNKHEVLSSNASTAKKKKNVTMLFKFNPQSIEKDP